MLFSYAIKTLEKRGYTIIKYYSSGTCSLLQNGNIRIIILRPTMKDAVNSITCYDSSSGQNLCIASTEKVLNVKVQWAYGMTVEKMMEILDNDSHKIIPKFAQYKMMQDLDQLAG